MSSDILVGLVLTGRNNIFTVQVDDAVLLCRLRGKRLALDERSYNPLAPGDLVEIGDVDTAHATGVIERREERRNAFLRFNRKRSAPQTLAANVDRVYCIASVSKPAFRSRFVDRFLALAEDQGLRAGLVLNKADLNREKASLIVDRYRTIGYPAFATASPLGDGVEALRADMEGGITVFVGQSGVGKSTLLNRLFGHTVQKEGRISDKYHRGMHTTNAARLVQEAQLQVIDTPGIRELDVSTIEISRLGWCFLEFREFIGSCDHSDCAHVDEPTCAVQTAVVDGRISEDRYESYVRLYHELQELETT